MKKILIVDDDQMVGETTQDMVAGEGYDAILVPTPQEALEELAKHNSYAVLTDLNMPDMNGIQLAAKSQELYGSRYPFALITARALALTEEEKKAATKAGIDIILEKPINYTKFVKALEMLTTPSE